jgi:hypothetical protein
MWNLLEPGSCCAECLQFSTLRVTAKTSFPPDSPRVKTDLIGERCGPRALEKEGGFRCPPTPNVANWCITIVAIAMAKIVRDPKPKDGQDQLTSAFSPALQAQSGGSKQSYSTGVSPAASALANFQAVRGLTHLPRRVERRVGYEIPARLARSVKLHPRRPHAAFSCSGTITTTKPPVPTRNALWRSPLISFKGTGFCAGSSKTAAGRKRNSRIAPLV